ncbi:hypothetical protein L5515_018482 [Caenorhabditis briggsae]|uniref:Uncharacterized protein n=1 Tax=Caenorhabditis briggsae TaxID=6238 RepID=A0AAE9FH31_CAEBR|nr:hypothetical protein L5515_018482 [Caenorhabditis briggsae]
MHILTRERRMQSGLGWALANEALCVHLVHFGRLFMEYIMWNGGRMGRNFAWKNFVLLRCSHHPINTNLVILSAFQVFGSSLLSCLIALLKSSQHIIMKSQFLFGSYRVTVCLLKNMSMVTITVFYYIVFLSALQRIVLMVNAKIGTRAMTGRRLNLYLILLYPVAIVSAFNKIMVVDKTPWLEIGVITITLIMSTFNLFLVNHIEREPIACVHKTALAQTAPIIILLALFTAAQLYILTRSENFISKSAFQSLTTTVFSAVIPFFIIIGSSSKRKEAIRLMTCRAERRNARRTKYAASRTPLTGSNVASIVLTRF